MWVFQAMLVFLLVGCLMSFGWGICRFFIKPAELTPGIKLTTACGLVFSICHIAILSSTRDITILRAATAGGMYVFSFGIFWWAIAATRKHPLQACFSPDTQCRLIQHGPFRFVRHPFYASYLLTWAAGFVATHSVFLLMTALVMLAIYVYAATAEEKAFSLSQTSSAYGEYRRRTGLFLPNPAKLLAWRSRRMRETKGNGRLDD